MPFALSRLAVATAAASCFLAPTAAVHAQQQQQSRAIDEVVVTARKREESIQDVPVSVTSIGAELREASLRRLDDIQSFTPNVYIRNTTGIPGGAAISIRGVSYQETDKTLDPSIGVVMDGLYLGTSSGSLMNNFDVKRIEVLRGPQGTLFGKNTTGGVVNIIRGDVTMEWGGDVRATIGNEGRRDIRGVLNMPLIEDQLGLKLFAAGINSDGWMRNTTIGEDALGDKKQTYGFTTLWRPSDTFDVKFHYEHHKDKTDTGAFTNLNQPGDLACDLEGIFWPVGCAASDTGSDQDNSSTNDRNRNDSQYDTAILTMNWDIPNFLVTSITGWRDMDEQYRIEFDASPANLLSFDYFNEWEQFSQELRLTSNFEGPVEFIVGAYYWDVKYQQRWNVRDLNFALQSLGIPQVPPPQMLTPNSINYNGQNQRTKSWATFGSADWHLNDQWTLTAAVRWTYEEKDFQGADGTYYEDGDPVPPLNFSSFSDDWSEISPKLGLRYQHNNNMMVFASWSEGFKSGGFFGRQANFDIDPTYDPEYVTTWELGMKSTWLDGRLIFNPTVFYNEYDDKQEEILIPISLSNVATVVRNASSVDIFGAEAELQMQVTDAWNVRLSYGYVNAKYDDYIADISGDGVITDNSNLTPRNTPKHTIGVNTSYAIPMGPGELVAFASYRWRDEVETIANNDPLGRLGSIQNLDLTLTYAWADDRYRVSAFGRNITDERERVVVRIPGLTTWGNWNQGANYGLELQASF
ncbi:MAG: TonB-dependent receptor [Gammaproteobacteria bacterium]|nr:TonB-dependent receptor [Gammaproteobacteria bacterium]